jgi:hypothetical protein
MEHDFVEVLRIIAHISEKLRDLSDDLDRLYEELTTNEIAALFKEI